jgi:hypothetical protein
VSDEVTPNPFSQLFATGKKKKAGGAKPRAADNFAQAAKKENSFIIVIAILIAALVGASLWVSVKALTEKVRFSRELQQIIEIVANADDAAANHRLDENGQEDLLALLMRLGRIEPTGEREGFKTLTNPWGGEVVASTMPGGHIRIETMMPPLKCRRIIDLFDQNLKPLGIEQIAVKDGNNNWHNMYTDHTKANDAQMTDLCSNPFETDIVLTFSLH